jgi:hypothetical protein
VLLNALGHHPRILDVLGMVEERRIEQLLLNGLCARATLPRSASAGSLRRLIACSVVSANSVHSLRSNWMVLTKQM